MKRTDEIDPSLPLSNSRHEMFVQELIKGNTKIGALLVAYPARKKSTYKKQTEAAGRVYKCIGVQERYQYLMDTINKKNVAQAQERMEILTQIARTSESEKSRISAIDTLNKMTGEYVKRVETTITSSIDETAEKIKSILDGTDK